MPYELVVGAALTYIGATIRSGAMAYPYLLTLKLTRGGANVQRTPSQLSRALLISADASDQPIDVGRIFQ